MRKLGELIHTHSNDLSTLLTSEQGKPFAEAKGEVAFSGMFFDWFAEEAKRIYGDVIPGPSGTRYSPPSATAASDLPPMLCVAECLR